MPRIPKFSEKELELEKKELLTFIRANKPKVTNWTEHKASWNGCKLCTLHEHRTKICLARGAVPCNVLFVGESPGQSENVLGQPFIGNAGKLLDELIGDALHQCRRPEKIKVAFTNLVACIPLEPDGRTMVDPTKEQVEACSVRLQEFVDLTKPRAIVMAGRFSQKYAPKSIDYDFEFSLDIIHPAALLRLDASQGPLAIQRTTVSIRDLFNQVEP